MGLPVWDARVRTKFNCFRTLLSPVQHAADLRSCFVHSRRRRRPGPGNSELSERRLLLPRSQPRPLFIFTLGCLRSATPPASGSAMTPAAPPSATPCARAPSAR